MANDHIGPKTFTFFALEVLILLAFDWFHILAHSCTFMHVYNITERNQMHNFSQFLCFEVSFYEHFVGWQLAAGGLVALN